MIHIFHGFLGSPDDFSFLGQENVILHDLYHMNSPPKIHESDTLIGYSMGGRMALELASSCQYQLKQLVLISAHPGLFSEEERIHRREFELKVVQELQTKDRNNFLSWWNGLPIFSSDQPITTTEERYSKSLNLFLKHRLSEQANHLNEMKLHKDKILYLAGQYDKKYMDLVSTILLPLQFRVKILPCGHRVFQLKHEIRETLFSEGVL